jgi:hypothetical protein
LGKRLARRIFVRKDTLSGDEFLRALEASLCPGCKFNLIQIKEKQMEAIA